MRPALFSFFLFDDIFYFVFKIDLPLDCYIEVIDFVGTFARTLELLPVYVTQIPFERLAVFLVHSQQEEWQHRDDHE